MGETENESEKREAEEKECDKANNSLFILIKKGSADITQEISSPRSDMAVTCPALQCKEEGWRHSASL